MVRSLAVIFFTFLLVSCGPPTLSKADAPEVTRHGLLCEADSPAYADTLSIGVQADPSIGGFFSLVEFIENFVKSYEADQTACADISDTKTRVFLSVDDRTGRFMYRLIFPSIVDLTETKLDRHPVNGIGDIHAAADFRLLVYCAATHDTASNPEFMNEMFENDAVAETGKYGGQMAATT